MYFVRKMEECVHRKRMPLLPANVNKAMENKQIFGSV
jgi:hypothetical protein